MIGTQEIQSLLNTIMLIVSPLLTTWERGIQRPLPGIPSGTPMPPIRHVPPERVKDDEKHGSVSVRWTLSGQWNTAVD